MSRHIYSLLCSKLSIDQKTNTISIFEVLERLEFTLGGTKVIPEGVPFTATFLSMWARSDQLTPEKHKQRLRLLSPNGKDLGTFEMEVDLTEFPRARTFAEVHGLKLDGQGWYEWQLEAQQELGQWIEVARFPLEVAVRLE